MTSEIKWSAFPVVSAPNTGDTIVGLRAGSNVQFIPPTPLFGDNVVVVTIPSQAMLIETIYITNYSGLVTFTLPRTSSIGDRIAINGYSSSGWLLNQNLLQQIAISPATTTIGIGGSIASTNGYDCINLICVVANLVWSAFGAPQSRGLTII